MSAYPGQGLSTDELLFALGKDLERKLVWYAQSLNRMNPPPTQTQPRPTV